jgi:hypothetical protein
MLANNIFTKNNVEIIEDFGCGNCVFKEYLKNINYIGING